jgi:hypothetical protein
MKATQKERSGSVTSVVAMGSPQRHGVVSPIQQAHDTSTLVRNLLARMMNVEAKAEETEQKRTKMAISTQQAHDTSTLVDLLARMAKVEAKAKEADDKWRHG